MALACPPQSQLRLIWSCGSRSTRVSGGGGGVGGGGGGDSSVLEWEPAPPIIPFRVELLREIPVSVAFWVKPVLYYIVDLTASTVCILCFPTFMITFLL